MDVVFLDANVLFSAAYRSEAGLHRLWDLKGVELVSSAYAVEEAARNLPSSEKHRRLDRFLRKTRIVSEPSATDYERGDVAKSGLPPKDIPILAAAIGARATHLLTGDVTHFGHLFGKKVGNVTILAPNQYLRGALGKGQGPG